MIPTQKSNFSLGDFDSPFSAGQCIGLMVLLEFLERNPDTTEEFRYKLKNKAAEGARVYMKIPTEDIHLIVSDLVEEIDQL